jgi:hypothetical protein
MKNSAQRSGDTKAVQSLTGFITRLVKLKKSAGSPKADLVKINANLDKIEEELTGSKGKTTTSGKKQEGTTVATSLATNESVTTIATKVV